ncbi:MAG TPA: TetR/AcrR family transcriptional regulator [bacterium]|mgnify:CR=1 FL=1|nr:TetR/AcrR family transcriptional regulator [bacterium]HPN31586.1 TetR/AcrR family transcriptional regulator [bacterium]
MKNNKTKKKETLDLIMKESILSAAADALLKYGAGGFTMERVATVANIAKGTVYLYFKSKNDLLKHLIEKMKKPIWNHIIEVKESGAPVKEKFEKILFHLLSGIESNLVFARILLRAAELDEELKKNMRKDDQSTIRIFEEILKEGVRSKEIYLSNPAYAAKIIFASMII